MTPPDRTQVAIMLAELAIDLLASGLAAPSNAGEQAEQRLRLELGERVSRMGAWSTMVDHEDWPKDARPGNPELHTVEGRIASLQRAIRRMRG